MQIIDGHEHGGSGLLHEHVERLGLADVFMDASLPGRHDKRVPGRAPQRAAAAAKHGHKHGPRAGDGQDHERGDDDAELDGRELITDRLVDEVGWLRQCAGWLTRLHAGEFSPAVNLRPGGDHPSGR